MNREFRQQLIVTRWYEYGILGLIIIALIIRWPFIERVALHSDEYLTLYRSLLISEGDFFLQADPSQKPPLLYFVLALLFSVFGPGRSIGLWVGMLSSLALIPATACVARRLSGSQLVGLFAATLVTLSPLHSAFSYTVFLDPPMILLAVLALGFALRHEFVFAALSFCCAFAVKQQSILFFPIFAFCVYREGISRRELIKVMLILLFTVVALFAWSLGSRTGLIPHFIAGQIANEMGGIGEGGIVDPFAEGLNAWGERLADWLLFVQLYFGDLGFAVLILSIAVVAIPNSGLRNAEYLRGLALWLLGIVAFHTLVRFRIVDRYLLLGIPIAACVIAGVLAELANRYARWKPVIFAIAALLIANEISALRFFRGNPVVSPQSKLSRVRAVGSFTEGSPLSFSAINSIKKNFNGSTELYVHGALFPAARFEFDEFATVRDIRWPLRFMQKESDSNRKILIWDARDARRILKVKERLEKGGYKLEPTTLREIGESRLAIYLILKHSDGL